MKFTKFSLSIITFFVGSLTVWLGGAVFNFNETSSNSPTPINKPQAISPAELITQTSPASEPRFTATLSADGFGWWTYYKTNDGQHLIHGCKGFDTPRKARAELKRKIKRAARIVERNPNRTNGNKILGERIVLINPADKGGKKTASILFYSGNQFIFSIDAPSLELAYEFESFKQN